MHKENFSISTSSKYNLRYPCFLISHWTALKKKKKKNVITNFSYTKTFHLFPLTCLISMIIKNCIILNYNNSNQRHGEQEDSQLQPMHHSISSEKKRLKSTSIHITFSQCPLSFSVSNDTEVPPWLKFKAFPVTK